jgi:hypothetical protein
MLISRTMSLTVAGLHSNPTLLSTAVGHPGVAAADMRMPLSSCPFAWSCILASGLLFFVSRTSADGSGGGYEVF